MLCTFLRSPYARRAVLVGIVAIVAWRGYLVIYDRGVADCEARHSRALAESIISAQKKSAEITVRDTEVTQKGAAERERIRTVYRDREIEIVKHVPADCNACRISPAGIGMLNDALSNAAAAAKSPGSQPAPVPQPAVPSPGGQHGGNGSVVDSRVWKVL